MNGTADFLAYIRAYNDTPGPVPGGCGREDCGHAREDHYSTNRTGAYGHPLDVRRYNEGSGPCNVRGNVTHCICYAWAGTKGVDSSAESC